MTGRYAVLAGRIRQDLGGIERIVDRVERGLRAHEKHAAERAKVEIEATAVVPG